MNDERAFQEWLDAHPDDHTARLVFADWLEERGDLRASGMRALGVNRLRAWNALDHYLPNQEHPQEWLERFDKGWSREHNPTYRSVTEYRHCLLPSDWFFLVSYRYLPDKDNLWWVCLWETAVAAELAVAVVFPSLPAKRQAELLEGVLV